MGMPAQAHSKDVSLAPVDHDIIVQNALDNEPETLVKTDIPQVGVERVEVNLA